MRLYPLCVCPICDEGIYSVDDSTYFAKLRDGTYTSNPNEIIADGQDLDGKAIHEDCLWDAESNFTEGGVE